MTTAPPPTPRPLQRNIPGDQEEGVVENVLVQLSSRSRDGAAVERQQQRHENYYAVPVQMQREKEHGSTRCQEHGHPDSSSRTATAAAVPVQEQQSSPADVVKQRRAYLEQQALQLQMKRMSSRASLLRRLGCTRLPATPMQQPQQHTASTTSRSGHGAAAGGAHRVPRLAASTSVAAACPPSSVSARSEQAGASARSVRSGAAAGPGASPQVSGRSAMGTSPRNVPGTRSSLQRMAASPSSPQLRTSARQLAPSPSSPQLSGRGGRASVSPRLASPKLSGRPHQASREGYMTDRTRPPAASPPGHHRSSPSTGGYKEAAARGVRSGAMSASVPHARPSSPPRSGAGGAAPARPAKLASSVAAAVPAAANERPERGGVDRSARSSSRWAASPGSVLTASRELSQSLGPMSARGSHHASISLLPPHFPPERLIEAARSGDAKAVHNCLAAGLPPTIRDAAGWSPLHWAAAEGHGEVCRQLLRHGCPVDVQLPDLSTPLMLAVEEGYLSVARLLLDDSCGSARVWLKDEVGFTALDRCAPAIHDQFAKLIHEEERGG
eukprot:TRINITY_DN14595_c2_g1_i1.p1 TRINITY_DN14595_c2_g1~~TRINITY_DN14595_c2_g1_i1.p1  ORF type:complete len:555 (-),score=115.09 TRINITY_DN14595_c2_g1_i1:318-1982(-)